MYNGFTDTNNRKTRERWALMQRNASRRAKQKRKVTAAKTNRAV